MKKKYCFCLPIALLSLISPTIFAALVPLYEQPKADSQLIGNVDASKGIMVIYTPKDSGWVKIADPNNGNTGWTKKSDLKGIGMTFNVINSGDGRVFQVMQYGNLSPYTPEQISKMMEQLRQRQKAFQIDLEKMMKDFSQETMFQWDNFSLPPMPKGATQPAPEKKQGPKSIEKPIEKTTQKN